MPVSKYNGFMCLVFAHKPGKIYHQLATQVFVIVFVLSLFFFTVWIHVFIAQQVKKL